MERVTEIGARRRAARGKLDFGAPTGRAWRVYNFLVGMRRILQTLTAFLVVATVATPLMELLDRWDVAGGLGNDTEMHVFCWVLGISLILTVVYGLSRLFLHTLSCLMESAPAQVSAYALPSPACWAFAGIHLPTCSPPLPLRI